METHKMQLLQNVWAHRGGMQKEDNYQKGMEGGTEIDGPRSTTYPNPSSVSI